MKSTSGHITYYMRFLTLFFGALLCITQSNAQTEFPTVFPQPILIVDQDGLFNNSRLGQAILLEHAERRAVLQQESRIVGEAFESEEKQLTETRTEVSAEEFRLLSEDFDIRVQAARASQLEKDVELQQSVDGQRRRFLIIAAPFLSKIMLKYHASAIVDQRSVLLFDRNMDITIEAIKVLDLAFEQNPDLAIEKE